MADAPIGERRSYDAPGRNPLRITVTPDMPIVADPRTGTPMMAPRPLGMDTTSLPPKVTGGDFPGWRNLANGALDTLWPDYLRTPEFQPFPQDPDPDRKLPTNRAFYEDNPFSAGAMLAADIGTLGPAKLVAGAAKAAAPLAGLAAKRAAQAKQAAEELLGRFPTTTPAAIQRATREHGGYSVNLPTGVEPKTGLMMGRYANIDPRNIVTDKLRRKDIERFVATNQEVLRTPAHHLGTWRDPNTGTVYVDVARRFEPDQIRTATKFGERTDQLAGFNKGTNKEFPVGNWNEFIASPEFQQRMNEMAKAGSEYLKQFPKEWRDIRGSTFERVYGPERLPDVAGYLAVTARPGSPRRSVQEASKYLRRGINGEPIVQPDWRAPEGLMTQRAGTKMPLEKSRADNLERVARGDIEAMQADKVRNEAKALLGDPNAFVGDRWWARLAESPARGIFTETAEGSMRNPKVYWTIQDQVAKAAERAGRTVRDYSADVWTGIAPRCGGPTSCSTPSTRAARSPARSKATPITSRICSPTRPSSWASRRRSWSAGCAAATPTCCPSCCLLLRSGIFSREEAATRPLNDAQTSLAPAGTLLAFLLVPGVHGVLVRELPPYPTGVGASLLELLPVLRKPLLVAGHTGGQNARRCSGRSFCPRLPSSPLGGWRLRVCRNRMNERHAPRDALHEVLEERVLLPGRVRRLVVDEAVSIRCKGRGCQPRPARCPSISWRMRGSGRPASPPRRARQARPSWARRCRDPPRSRSPARP